MISLFGPRLPIDREELDWQLATYQWLIAEFGALGEETPLILPTPEYFPGSPNEGDALVRELFDRVRGHAGMEEWACDLERGEGSRPIDAGNRHLLRHEGPNAPSGTFQLAGDGERAIITYNPDLSADIPALIATFAHELAHYLMSRAASAPPGGWDLHELHTDLCAVYLGFGIFLANGARDFRQFQSAGEMGWSSRSQGYLSEGALTTALVIFQRLAGRDPMAAAPHLKSYLRKDLKSATRALARLHPDLAASVVAVDLSEYVRD